MKDILNLKIKRRESFRPFAPSVLREQVKEWFEQDDDVPFMMQVFQIREDKRGQIPAVTHVDGSGRLQTVHRDTNPRYYDLIGAFGDLTGVPMVLNTSFNENEPVVCKPAEALDCFLRTKMDVLVLGDFIVARAATDARAPSYGRGRRRSRVSGNSRSCSSGGASCGPGVWPTNGEEPRDAPYLGLERVGGEAVVRIFRPGARRGTCSRRRRGRSTCR